MSHATIYLPAAGDAIVSCDKALPHSGDMPCRMKPYIPPGRGMLLSHATIYPANGAGIPRFLPALPALIRTDELLQWSTSAIFAAMGRILSIDYGRKRTGLAVTDPLQIIATGLCTVETPKLMAFLKEYIGREGVELILIGMPTNMDDTATHATPLVKKFIGELQKVFPAIPIKEVDERFTSKMASQAMLQMGLKKKQRQNKGLVDEIAATMMLQEYMQRF
ncbi:MAG: Holliday junction resolvase [Flaviaesturariibacter sp.]|nr:Holliday junction resolvase [Flaviaesturariibacter sp.]